MTSARERLGLLLLLALAGALLALRARAQWPLDVFARVPINDARVYWNWAGELAQGRLVGDTPYFSAPLHPWLLGLLRAAGGGLAALVALQIALSLATAALTWRIARRSLSARGALLAPLLYLALSDAAYFPLRALNCTLVALCVAWLWERLAALEEEVAPRRVLLAGLALGLGVLANPVLLFAIPVVAIWTWRITRRALAPALGLAGTAVLCVAPATLHNYLACHEFIPLSAQAGVTFVHGNAPGADGTYHPIAGVSIDRVQQNLDARELVREESGGSWSGTDRAWFRRGLAWWASDPLHALGLALRKAWWFVAGRNYGDIYVPALESEAGLDPWSWSAPLPAAWLMLPALLVLGFAWRDRRRVFPALLLLGVPFATVVVFWYSPRYRFPALPVLAVLGAQALAIVLAGRGRDLRGALCALAFLLSALSAEANRLAGFDGLERLRPAHEHALAAALGAEGRLEEALEHERRAAALGQLDAAVGAGDLLRRLGRMAEARVELEDALAAQPSSAYAHKSLAIALAQQGELPQARRHFERARELAPNDAEASAGLGNVLLQQGEARAALDAQRQALALNPRSATAHYSLGLAARALGDARTAREGFEAAARLDPALVPAWLALSELDEAEGDGPAALRVLRVGLAGNPREPRLQFALAWILAASSDARARDARAALELAEELVRAASAPDGELLDLQATALAAAGRFGEAVTLGERAAELLRAARAPAARLAELEQRMADWRGGRSWVRGAR